MAVTYLTITQAIAGPLRDIPGMTRDYLGGLCNGGAVVTREHRRGQKWMMAFEATANGTLLLQYAQKPADEYSVFKRSAAP